MAGSIAGQHNTIHQVFHLILCQTAGPEGCGTRLDDMHHQQHQRQWVGSLPFRRRGLSRALLHIAVHLLGWQHILGNGMR